MFVHRVLQELRSCPAARGPMTRPSSSSRPSISLPTPLLDAYRSARATPEGATLPPLSTLCQRAVTAELLALGIPVPEAPPPARTAAATAARWAPPAKPPRQRTKPSPRRCGAFSAMHRECMRPAGHEGPHRRGLNEWG